MRKLAILSALALTATFGVANAQMMQRGTTGQGGMMAPSQGGMSNQNMGDRPMMKKQKMTKKQMMMRDKQMMMKQKQTRRMM